MRRVNVEHSLYLFTFLLALGVRFLNLGLTPLSDFEAEWAFQSLLAAQGNPVTMGPNPGYFSLTSLLFFVSESSNALARFWPALVGSLLVIVPFFWRDLLGRKAALVTAFGLALDPGLVVVSRLAGGPILAIGLGALALATLWHRNYIWAGILGGLALISGPSILTGLLGLGMVYGVGKLTGIFKNRISPAETESPAKSRVDVRLGLLMGGATMLLGSTIFFRFPQGIGAWANTFTVFFQGWGQFSGVPVLQPLIAVIIYQPLALGFGLVAIGRGWLRGDKTVQMLSVWLGFALFLPLVYPGREVLDVTWALLPLWGLAGYEIQHYCKLPWPRVASYGQALVVFILLAVMWVVSLRLPMEGPVWLILVIIPILIILTTILVGLGWSPTAAKTGLAWGVTFALGAYGVAGLFGATQVQPQNPAELWPPDNAPAQADLLVETLENLALIQTGHKDALDIVAVSSSPALRWALRNFSDVRTAATINPDLNVTVIITSESEGDLSQTRPYRGQDFVWSGHQGWEGALPSQWFQWVTARRGPIWYDKLVLWARADLFPTEPKPEIEVVDPVPGEELFFDEDEGLQ